MKVYCINCKWYEEPSYLFPGECSHLNAIFEVDTFEKPVKQTVSPQIKNKHNNCPDYEEKK